MRGQSSCCGGLSPARLLNLMISMCRAMAVDIASGPTVADPTTCADALDIVGGFAIALVPAARDLYESGRGGDIEPGDCVLVSRATSASS